MRIVLVIALGIVAASSASAHKEDDGTKTPTDPNKVVCKTEDVIGSRLQTEKHCMTVAQWNQMERDNYKVMDRIQGRSAQQGR